MTAIITLDEAKSRLPIRPGNADFDARITSAIVVAQSQIEAFCRRKFDRAERRELFHVQGGSTRVLDLMNSYNTDGYIITPTGTPLYLSFDPVVADTIKVFYDLNRRFGEDTELFADDIHFLPEKSCVFVYRPMVRSRDSVLITYTGGPTDVPPEVKEAALMQTVHFFKRSTSENVSTSSDKDSGAQKEPYSVKAGLLPEVRNILMPYRKMLRSRT